MQKDKLWKVEATICKAHQEDVCSMLNKAKIPYNYIEGVGKYTIFNIFCATQKQSVAVKEILKAYNAKYFVSESKTLWYLKKVLTNKKINVIIIIENEREVITMLLMYTNKEAFERVKRFLEVNQYSFKFSISNGQFYIKIT